MPAYTEYKNKKYSRITEIRVWELKEIMKIAVKEAMEEMEMEKEAKNATPSADNESKFIYGLSGLMKFLNIASSTASNYRATFLKPAVFQKNKNGNLVFDAAKVAELYEQHIRKTKRLAKVE